MFILKIISRIAGIVYYAGIGNTYVESAIYAAHVSIAHAHAARAVIARHFARADDYPRIEIIPID